MADRVRATSLTDLLAVMSLSKSSFYAEFTSKAALYRTCLLSYQQLIFRHLGGLRKSSTSLRDFFETVFQEAINDAASDDPKGCLIVSSAVEFGQQWPSRHNRWMRIRACITAQTSLTAEERNVVWLTVSIVNECHYCVPAHTGLTHVDGLERPLIDALRNDATLSDRKLEALRQFTLALVPHHGRVSDEEQAAFLDAGYEPRHTLEVNMGVVQKILSNYVNYLAQTPLDDFASKFT